MKPLVIDASVWVSAADASDAFHAQSRAFLHAVVARRAMVRVPAIAPLEVACALARRLHDAARGRALAEGLLRSPLIEVVALDPGLLALALAQGTDALLRAADALYVATAVRLGATLVAWDRELIDRAGGLAPDAWLAQEGNP